MERWLLRGNRNAATSLIGELHGRVATPVMFGGGTLAIVMNPGSLVVKGEDRDAFLAAIGLVAPGNALVILDASQSGAKAPAPKRLADAIAAAGGTIRGFSSPREGALAGWIEAEARDRGLVARTRRRQDARRTRRRLRPGGRRRAPPTRPASPRWSSTSWRSTAARSRSSPTTSGRSSPRPCQRRSGPSPMPSASGASKRRSSCSTGCSRRRRSPSCSRSSTGGSASCSRRATGSTPASGSRPSARRWAITSEFRMEKLRDQARLWTTAELTAALDGLVELDAMVKGAPGSEVGRGAAAPGVRSVGDRSRRWRPAKSA